MHVLKKLNLYYFLFIFSERRRGQNILDWDVLKQYAITNGIYDEKDVSYFMLYFLW